MDTTLEAVLRDGEEYRTVWYETYEPVRRALAGVWHCDGPEWMQLYLDSHGHCEWTRFEPPEHAAGRYTVVAHRERHYLVLEFPDGGMRVFRVEDLDGWRLVLHSVDVDGAVIEFTRRIRGDTRAA